MAKDPATSEISDLSALAGEIRVSIAKLNRRLREQAHPGDFTSAQKSVILRLERDGPATVSMLARAESVRRTPEEGNEQRADHENDDPDGQKVPRVGNH